VPPDRIGRRDDAGRAVQDLTPNALSRLPSKAGEK
jgi:hypothetical protein